MSEIKSITEILAFLREQAALRSPENDEGGLLRDTADYLEYEEAQLSQLWPDDYDNEEEPL